MFGDERTSAKELVFGAASGTGLGGFRGNWRRTCVCAVTPPPTFANLITLGLKPNTKFSTIGQSVLEIRRWSVRVRTCKGTHNPTNDLYETHSYLVTNHPLHFSTVRPAVSKIWKRGSHVRTCGCTPPMTCVKHLGNDSKPTHQI